MKSISLKILSAVLCVVFAILIFSCGNSKNNTGGADSSTPKESKPHLYLNFQSYGSGLGVAFIFNLPMVDGENLSEAEIPDIEFEPEQQGQFTWLSDKELEFVPDEGSMKWGERIEVKAWKLKPLDKKAVGIDKWSRKFTVNYFQMAGKVASWPIRRGQPRLMGLLHSYTRKFGEGPVILMYDQPVETELFKEQYKIQSADGAYLDYELVKPRNTEYIFDQRMDVRHLIGINLPDNLSENTLVYFRIASWKEGGLVSESFQLKPDYNFSTTYSYIPKKSNGRVPLEGFYEFNFNKTFNFTYYKNKFTVEPEPKGFSIYGNDHSINMQMTLEPGIEYTLSTREPVLDMYGNQLSNFSYTFQSVDLPPILKVPENALFLEKKGGRIPLKVRNVHSLKAQFIPLKSADQIARAFRLGNNESTSSFGLSENNIEFSVPIPDSKPNILENFDFPCDGALGAYVIFLTGAGYGSEAADVVSTSIVAQITDVGISSKISEGKLLAWITSLETAGPIANAKVSAVDSGGELLGSGVTDASGVITLDVGKAVTRNGVNRRLLVVAETGNDRAVYPIVNNELTEPWEFGLSRGNSYGDLRASIFSERGIYRPGDSVKLKILFHKEDVPSNKQVDLTIRDPRGQSELHTTISLDDFYSGHVEYDLAEKAVVGHWLVQVTSNYRSKNINFQVEEYRIPTFVVKIDSSPQWNHNQNVTVRILAEYLHGGFLANREVNWKISREPVAFKSDYYPLYSFQYKLDSSLAGIVTNNSDQLDDKGSKRTMFRPDHPAAAGPMKYYIEANVTDVDRQNYAGYQSRVVHPTDLYIGVKKPSRKVFLNNEEIDIPFVVCNLEGVASSGKNVKAEIEVVQYHTSSRVSSFGQVQTVSRPVGEIISSKSYRSDHYPLNYIFRLSRAGQYRIWFTTKDSKNIEVSNYIDLFVSGDDPVPWPRFDKSIFDIVLDKTIYQDGDTARLIVQSPYEKAQGLLCLERGEVIESRIFSINKNTPVLDIPITGAMAPNIFASVILLRGREHYQKDALGFETGAPGFKIAYAKIPVKLKQERLDLQIKGDAQVYEPGEDVTIELNLLDYQNTPVQGRAALMVVDEAVLSLINYVTPDPLLALYPDFPLGVRNASSRLNLPYSRRSRFESLFPGGSDDSLSLKENLSFLIRRLFKSTAYWNPDVAFDSSGMAKVSFTLPDNTTSYRVMAVAYDKNSRVDSSDKMIKARKALMVQPALPRFLYADDEFLLETNVFNGTAEAGELTLKIEVDGLSVNVSDLNQKKALRSEDLATFTSTAKVLKRDEVTVRFMANFKNYSDSAEYKIPVLIPGTTRTIVQSHLLKSSSDYEIQFPDNRIENSESLELVASTSFLTELKDSVKYLMQYPHGCIEQTTSTAYPLVVLEDLLKDIGVEVDREKLREYSESGIKRILTFQTSSGGLSYWPGGASPHAFGTAFGSTALIEAKKRGYAIPYDVLPRIADYMEKSLRRGDIKRNTSNNEPNADTRALYVTALGRMGRPQASYISTLWREKDQLSGFGLSFLAIAIKESNLNTSLLGPILSEMKSRATVKGDSVDYSGSASSGFSMGSSTRTLAAVLSAFSICGQNKEDADFAEKLLAGLLAKRRYGLWGNTQNDVFGIMGVYDTVKNRPALDIPSIAVQMLGNEYHNSDFQKISESAGRLVFGPQQLDLDNRDGHINFGFDLKQSRPVNIIIRGAYELALKGKVLEPVNEGIAVKRSYETLKGVSLENQIIPLGEVLRVRIKISNPKDVFYCAVSDYLPAGLEPVNMNLKNTATQSSGEESEISERTASVLTYSEIRDHRASFYADKLTPNEYEFVFLARATTAGRFLRPAARAEAMYETSIYGQSATDWVSIK